MDKQKTHATQFLEAMKYAADKTVNALSISIDDGEVIFESPRLHQAVVHVPRGKHVGGLAKASNREDLFSFKDGSRLTIAATMSGRILWASDGETRTSFLKDDDPSEPKAFGKRREASKSAAEEQEVAAQALGIRIDPPLKLHGKEIHPGDAVFILDEPAYFGNAEEWDEETGEIHFATYRNPEGEEIHFGSDLVVWSQIPKSVLDIFRQGNEEAVTKVANIAAASVAGHHNFTVAGVQLRTVNKLTTTEFQEWLGALSLPG